MGGGCVFVVVVVIDVVTDGLLIFYNWILGESVVSDNPTDGVTVFTPDFMVERRRCPETGHVRPFRCSSARVPAQLPARLGVRCKPWTHTGTSTRVLRGRYTPNRGEELAQQTCPDPGSHRAGLGPCAAVAEAPAGPSRATANVSFANALHDR